MLENDIFDEYEKIKNDVIKLFNFSVKYGIYEIVKFLYERKGVEYDILADYGAVIKSTNPGPTDMVAMTGSSNTTCNIQVWDKFTRNRNICISYLMNIKKYSKSRRNRKKFYYKFNPKYLNVIA
jgi:hypothetical protein